VKGFDELNQFLVGAQLGVYLSKILRVKYVTEKYRGDA
jgi:hypothetical protein